jgi:hypothetical protein
MKIRIRGNSIRYRLTRTDVSRMGTDGVVEETTRFPDGNRFHYRLERSAAIKELQATYAENRITLLIPDDRVREWTGSEIIGFRHHVPLPDGSELLLLVEKDFACLDHTLEDQSDNYPNPNKTC